MNVYSYGTSLLTDTGRFLPTDATPARAAIRRPRAAGVKRGASRLGSRRSFATAPRDGRRVVEKVFARVNWRAGLHGGMVDATQQR
jgi:hypothetical protein